MNLNETPIYQQIAEQIRREIIEGNLKPGDRLPSVRQMTKKWQCTPGTVQRAYRELARQNLVSSRPGQGTHILDEPIRQINPSLKKARLVHQAEKFILEAVTNSYSTQEIEQAFQTALDRWKTVSQQDSEFQPTALEFTGSHDVAVNWISAHFPGQYPQYEMQVSFAGSLGGLIALAEKKAVIAGAHLWDPSSQTYNATYVQKILPGKKVALVTVAYRRLGFILENGNPLGIQSLSDLAKPNIQFINRQSGSGTRVWFDRKLAELNISPDQIRGYDNEVATHSEVARQIVEGNANVGIGLEAAALSYGLAFHFLNLECYDFIIPHEHFYEPAIQALLSWLKLPSTKFAISALGGYDTEQTGQIRWVGE